LRTTGRLPAQRRNVRVRCSVRFLGSGGVRSSWWGGCHQGDLLSQEKPESVPSVNLCNFLLITLAVLEMTRSGRFVGINKLWADQAICLIGVASPRPPRHM
jgi:hypothetical protein